MTTEINFESEHQELFALGADLSKPVEMHVPSALGTLGYYVCLRVPSARVAELKAMRVHIKVGGLRPDDVSLGWGEGVEIPPEIPSRVEGETWVLHSRARLSRGDGVIEFSCVPAGLERAPMLLCTWPRFIASGEADQYIACQSDPRWAPTGIPLGGIGCGKVELSRDGRFRCFTGNNNQDMAFEEPDGLAGAMLEVSEGAVRRILATRGAAGVEPVPSLEADCVFPQVRLAARDAFDGIDVEVLAAGPFVPHDLALSTLPGAVFRWKVVNRGKTARRVECSFRWPNLVGRGGGIGRPEQSTGKADGSYMYWDAPFAPRIESCEGNGLVFLRFANDEPGPRANADGFHILATSSGRAGEVLADDTDSRFGALVRKVEVAPGESATFDMALVWEMPRNIDVTGVDRGHYWQNTFADGVEIAKALLENAGKIIGEGRALRDFLVSAGVEEWIWRRLCDCNYPLATNSIHLRDGRFSVNEGPTEMSGCYGTLDQRIGAHPATQLFFPALNARELRMFAANQAENGGMPHDFGCGHLERGADDNHWPDLTCSFVIQAARHAWTTGDAAFAREMWPRVRMAVLRHREWAAEGNGVAQVGHGLGTSYDGYHYHGTMSYVGTLWIAALDIARAWASDVGDGEFIALTDGYADLARARLEADLWNGSYYRAYAGFGRVNDNVHAGTLAGEYFDRMLAVRDVLPRERLDECADALVSCNCNAKFAVPPDEVSADLSSYTEYGWLPYVECFCVAPLAVAGRIEAIDVWKRILKAMDDDGRRPCDTRLMYQPVSGKPSWGSYYMTAPASWLVYDAINDFAFRATDGVLRFNPLRDGGAALVHPLFWARARREGGLYEAEVVRAWRDAGEATIREIEVPAAACGVEIDGAPLSEVSRVGAYARYALPAPVAIDTGATLRWKVL